MENTITREQFKEAAKHVTSESDFANKMKSDDAGLSGLIAIITATMAFRELEVKLFGKED